MSKYHSTMNNIVQCQGPAFPNVSTILAHLHDNVGPDIDIEVASRK